MQHNLFLCTSGAVMYVMTSEGSSDIFCAMSEAHSLLNQHHQLQSLVLHVSGAYVSIVYAGQHIQNINWVMAFLILCWFVITIIYIVVRATKSLHLGKATAYGVWVLVMEVSLPI